MTDYFTLFFLEPSFTLDEVALRRAYFALQAKYHPDRLAQKPEAERVAALSLAMEINQAYDTLSSPQKRAEYLLLLQGIKVNSEQDTVKPEQSLLLEMLEARERLAESVLPEEVELLEAECTQEKTRLLAELTAFFSDKRWQEAAQATMKLHYLQKFLEEAKIKRKILTHAT